MGILDSIVGGITSGGGMINSFLNPGRGYEKAGDDVRNAWAQAMQFLQPYQQAGINQIGKLTGAEDKLLDPAALQNEWTSGYSESPYAKQLTNQATDAGLTSAAQQGLLGSSAALNNVQSSSSNIMNADRQQYLNDLMQKYLSGIGIGQNIYNAGAGAAGQLASGQLQTGEDLGQADFGRMNAPGELLQKLIGTAAGAYSGGMGGI